MWWWQCNSNHKPHRSCKTTHRQICFSSQWPDFVHFPFSHLQLLLSLLTISIYHLLSTVYHLHLPSQSTVYCLPESLFVNVEHNHNRFSKGWTIFGKTLWGKLTNVHSGLPKYQYLLQTLQFLQPLLLTPLPPWTSHAHLLNLKNNRHLRPTVPWEQPSEITITKQASWWASQ